MDEKDNESNGQGNGNDSGNDNQNNGNDGQPKDNGGEGAGQTIKIGDKEYTPEQLKEIADKAGQYDQLLPDYTRKSQKLSEYEKGGNKGEDGKKDDKPPYYDSEWKPKNYKELADAIKMAEENGEKRALARLQEMEQQRNDAKSQVDNFVSETKKQDKAFDENDFFEFVAKYNLKVNSVDELKSIYSLYKDSRDSAIEKKDGGGGTEKRKDSVSGAGGGKGSSFSMPINEIRRSGSAVEAAIDALGKLKK